MINKIIKNHLCLGCGLCASILGHENCKMYLKDDGFYYPKLLHPVNDSVIKDLCPGIRAHGNCKNELWGKLTDVVEGWACNNDIRFHSSSGGIVSALSIFLLEEKKVDAVLHIGVSSECYLRNQLQVSRNKEDIIRNAQSRYAPALTLYNIKQILDESSENFAFIGKGCDIEGIINFISLYPKYKKRFILLISIVCAGMPSLKGTEAALKLSGNKNEPCELKYRGDGWPGFFEAKWSDGTSYQLSYQDSWGKILCRFLNFRCKICADGIGTLADISVGDSWKTKNGYPDFIEKEGRSLVFVRTEKGRRVMQEAKQNGYVDYHSINNLTDLEKIQPGQFNRRRYAGWRILPVKILTLGVLNFRGLGIISQAMRSNVIEGLKNMIGTLRRFIEIKRNKHA